MREMERARRRRLVIGARRPGGFPRIWYGERVGGATLRGRPPIAEPRRTRCPGLSGRLLAVVFHHDIARRPFAGLFRPGPVERRARRRRRPGLRAADTRPG